MVRVEKKGGVEGLGVKMGRRKSCENGEKSGRDTKTERLRKRRSEDQGKNLRQQKKRCRERERSAIPSEKGG